jgi:hypothetical protein
MSNAKEQEELLRGMTVRKDGAGYSGPGKVYSVFEGEDGHVRFVIGHTIEGGKGTFYHIYGAAQLSHVPKVK